MKKKYIFLILIIIIICVLGFFLNNYLIKRDNKGFYTLKNDNIPSIEKVLGKRHLEKKSVNNSSVLIKEYSYTNIDDVYTDLSIYVKHLKTKSNYLITKNYNLNNKSGKIELSNYSIKKNYILIIEIEYKNKEIKILNKS